MKLSRTVVLMILFTAGPARAGDALTAEQAMANYRGVVSVAPKGCQASQSPDEIVVCANKLRESQKVPFIEELRVGDRKRLIAGEVPSASGALYGSPCPPRGCPGGGSLFGAIGKTLERIRD